MECIGSPPASSRVEQCSGKAIIERRREVVGVFLAVEMIVECSARDLQEWDIMIG